MDKSVEGNQARDTEDDNRNMDNKTTKETQEESSSLKSPMKTIAFLSLSWFFVFSAYSVLEVTLSSLKEHAEIRLLTLAFLYLTKAFASLFGPMVFRHFSIKWVLVLGLLSHTLYIVANLFPSWYTILPGGLILGAATAFNWISLGLYITVTSIHHAENTGQSKADVLSRFNSFMSIVYMLTIVFGSVIAVAVIPFLQMKSVEPATGWSGNYSLNYSAHGADFISGDNEGFHDAYDGKSCGPDFCFTSQENVGLNGTSPRVIITTNDKPLILAQLGVNLIGVFISIFFLPDLPKTEITSPHHLNQRLKKQCLTLFHWQHLLLAPAVSAIYYGQPIIVATITAGFITCTYGLSHLGIAMTVFGAISTMTCIICILVGHFVSRHLLFLLAAMLWSAVLVLGFTWNFLPNIEGIYAWLYLMIFCMGTGQSLLMIYLPAFTGEVFVDTKTEAFSFYHFWSGLSSFAGFLIVTNICIRHQLTIMSIIILVAMPTYVALVFYHHVTNKRADSLEKEVKGDDQVSLTLVHVSDKTHGQDRHKLTLIEKDGVLHMSHQDLREIMTGSQLSLSFK